MSSLLKEMSPTTTDMIRADHTRVIVTFHLSAGGLVINRALRRRA